MPTASHGLHPEPQGQQYLALHGKDLIVGVVPSADIVVLLEFGRLDLFVLGCNEECGNAEQLVPISWHTARETVLIGDEDCQIEGVWVAAEVQVHLHQPSH